MLEDESVPKSADIVFIVEANQCNANIRRDKRLDMIIGNLDRELKTLNITRNRYVAIPVDALVFSSRDLSKVINAARRK